MNRNHLIYFTSGICFGWIALLFIVFNIDNTKIETIVKEIICEPDEPLSFSEARLINKMIDINIKFPHIVLAQSQLETGNFKSKIFRENHNLFGMKEAKSRVKLALGTKHGHAHYSTWLESLYDYAFMQCRYLGTIKNETDYYNYLGKTYAEDPDYIDKLKKMANKNKSYFK
jgi:flagellum-specific peptidoglycan hydrolase FlgJ